ncbi:MAG TPA: 2-oxo-4-hydroxy-4-carboxy-5-ureidoimidazoline decarboxylase [Chitinophagaceae bacterium]|nr:2-oxo-4-hydroxy-4-carboxy-5-ureidoimidazoline decarboxylase [Chitinophagaceae bacterium]
MTLSSFNNLDKRAAAKELFSCCGSQKWVSLMMKGFPFDSAEDLLVTATNAWYQECGEQDWKESFTHHPRIGDKKSLAKKFAVKEQAGIASATKEIIEALAASNEAYEIKFGFIFIVCANGRSAIEMLRLLSNRLNNDGYDELRIAMGEQHKITLLRFGKLFEDFQLFTMSQITTHVLDVAAGRPGRDIDVRLMNKMDKDWHTIAQGITNGDGRVSDLLPAGRTLSPGIYKIVFETGNYYHDQKIKTFYPCVEILFTVFDDSHYHVPLLISPFGYSTYRGT